MNVSLTPELDKFVSGKVESGRYTSASEVVRKSTSVPAMAPPSCPDVLRPAQLNALPS